MASTPYSLCLTATCIEDLQALYCMLQEEHLLNLHTLKCDQIYQDWVCSMSQYEVRVLCACNVTARLADSAVLQGGDHRQTMLPQCS